MLKWHRFDDLVEVIERLTNKVESLETKIECMSVLESSQVRLEDKMEKMAVDIENKVKILESKIADAAVLESSQKRLEDKMEQMLVKIVESVDKQRADNHDLRDCVQDAVRDKLQEDQQEMDDIKKRGKNVIIHGLSEAPDGDSESRRKVEEDQLQDLLHAMKCDDLSIQSIVRFGALKDSQQKPRPLKVELASEEQREQALTEAKNLRGNLTFGQVFVQRDLTVKQREKRRQLVQQLKANGEADLIIIQDKLVVRR